MNDKVGTVRGAGGGRYMCVVVGLCVNEKGGGLASMYTTETAPDRLSLVKCETMLACTRARVILSL